MKRYISSGSRANNNKNRDREILESLQGTDKWVFCFFPLRTTYADGGWQYVKVLSVVENGYGISCEVYGIPAKSDYYSDVNQLTDFMSDSLWFLHKHEYIQHIQVYDPVVICTSEELIESYKAGDKYLGGIWEE